MSPAAPDAATGAPAPLRVVFLGTPDFALAPLRALQTDPGIDVALAVTQPDRPSGRGRRLTPPPVKVFAEEHGVPVFQPERLRGTAVLARLREAAAGLFVIAAYGQILRQDVLDIPAHGCLNVHPSLLPRHRGPAPIAAAILAGDPETGVTIILTDRGMDTGPILAQRRVPLGRHETTASLTPALFDLGAALLLDTIPRWVRGEIVPRPQDEGRATVSRRFSTADGLIDWRRPALDLERQIRALNPWPRAYTYTGRRRLILLAARALDQAAFGEAPGTVRRAPDGQLRVATGDGWLLVTQVQPEGRRPLDAATYLRSHPEAIGGRLTVGPPGAAPAAM